VAKVGTSNPDRTISLKGCGAKIKKKIIWKSKVSQSTANYSWSSLFGFVDVYWCSAGRHVSTPTLGHHQVMK
jgi:hypothetical protein